MKIIALLSMFCFLASDNRVAHDFHLSKTDIHYKSDKKALQFTVHMFIDDLELAIEQEDSVSVFLFTNKESELADSLVSEYVSEHLKIDIDGKRAVPGYLGREISDDLQGIWVYLEIENLTPFSKMAVENTLLLDTYDDQKNIINVKADDRMLRFEILDKRSFSKEIKF